MVKMGKKKYKPLSIVKTPSAYMIEIWWVLLTGASVISKTVHDELKKLMPGTHPSRASVINYLNALVESKLLTFTENNGKGGKHRIYTLKGTKEDFIARLNEINFDQFQVNYMEHLEAP